MVIAVLAIIWVLALTPMMLRKLSEHRFTTSVDSFHRQLRGMRRAYPRLVATAAVPETMLSFTGFADDDQTAYVPPARVRRAPTAERSGYRAAQTAARRRRVLFVLIASAVGLFLLGFIPTLRLFWGLSLLVVATTAGYLALLIHIHRRSVELKAKVVDIRGLRSDTEVVSKPRAHATVISSRRKAEELEWDEDELFDPAFDYDFDESIAGGR